MDLQTINSKLSQMHKDTKEMIAYLDSSEGAKEATEISLAIYQVLHAIMGNLKMMVKQGLLTLEKPMVAEIAKPDEPVKPKEPIAP